MYGCRHVQFVAWSQDVCVPFGTVQHDLDGQPLKWRTVTMILRNNVYDTSGKVVPRKLLAHDAEKYYSSLSTLDTTYRKRSFLYFLAI